jgi:drug/metabolite transporter (DMT)-like permease
MLLVVLFWAGNFTAMKLGFRELPPLAFTAIRFCVASVVLWAIVRRVEGTQPLPKGAVGPLIILGVLGNTIYQLCFVEGLARTSATKSALILAGMPAVVTVAAWAFGIETVTVRQRFAVLLATVGVLVVVLGRGGTLDGSVGLGDLLLLGAVLTWAGYTLLLRRWELPISSLRLTAWIMYTGTPGLVIAAIPELRRTDWAHVSWAGWGGVAYAAILSLVLAYLLWNRGVAILGASRTVVYNTLVPLVAMVIAMVGLGERPGIIHLVGGALIIGGVLLTGKSSAPEG